ncbi:MAG: cupin domain-containing protein [Actinomycetes bacterium]
MSILPSGVGVSHAQDRRRLLWVGKTTFDLVLDASQTQGSIALLDQWGEQGDVTPMHIHHGEAEIFYVLQGSILAWAGDERVSLASGGAVYLPPDQPHAFGVTSPTARLISVTAPAGFAGFVQAAGIPVNGEVPATWEFDMGALMSAAADHDIDIVGPPPALPESLFGS